MDRKLLAAEFVECLQQRADASFGGKIHHAFVDWYIAAEFGEHAEWTFTDDARDGGIDAIVSRPHDTPSLIILQSKFTAGVGRAQLAKSAYKDFAKVVNVFRAGNDTFSEWLVDVRDDLRARYRKALTELEDIGTWAQQKKVFRLITTQKRRSSAEFEAIPEENFTYADDILRLYEQYRKGVTPRARDLELHVQQKLTYSDKKRKEQSYLFNARVSDFRRYLTKNDVARLVARNIRYNLSGRVGKDIKATYEKHPHDFWYFHNGITIVCDGFKVRSQRATIVNPSVINGAQTLYALSGANDGKSAAMVTVRVISRSGTEQPLEDDEWLQEVIRGVNTQNRVKAYDFRSNEPEQIELHKHFRGMQVFYERKRGEWREHRNEPRFRGFERLSLFRLGQILTSASESDGNGVMLLKRGLETVFATEASYRNLFPHKGKIGRRFAGIYLAYRLYRLLYIHGYESARIARRRRHGFWNTFWLLHRAVTEMSGFKPTLKDTRAIFDELEGTRRPGVAARKVMRQLTRLTWAAWRHGKRLDPEQWTPNNFFKLPYGNKVLVRHAYPKVKAALKPLRARLVAGATA